MTGAIGRRACRSHLFVPGNNERLLGKVFGAGADAAVIDLEDAVPAEAKAEARRMAAAAVATRAGLAGPRVGVRINGVDSAWWREDLAAVVGPGLDVIRVPKAESAEQFRLVDQMLHELEVARHVTAGSIGVVATIESAAGVLASADIARAPRVEAFTFGAADFVRDIGADTSSTDVATLYARQHLVLTSRAAGLQPPVASVYTQVKDLDGLRRTSDEARALGFFGRSCIHPSQVAIVNQVFTPSGTQVDTARRMLAAWDDAMAKGRAAFTMEDGQFVDEAVVGRARAVVAMAEALGGDSNHG
ncbi:MAG: CoA ester lyase [Acidobacteriota bacterium]